MNDMTPIERVQAAFGLKPVDRVPVVPLIDPAYPARSHGVQIADTVSDMDLASKLFLQTFDEMGGWDAINYSIINDLGASVLGIFTKLPGHQLGEDEIWQMVEHAVLEIDDYDFIIQNGWRAYLDKAYSRLVDLGMPVPAEKFHDRLKETGDHGLKDMIYWEDRGYPTLWGGGGSVPIERFRMSRSLKEIISDIFRRPEKVIAASEAFVEELVPQLISEMEEVKQITKWGYLSTYIGQNMATTLSPKNFEKFFWPYEKRIVNGLVEAGYTVWLHSDSNWTPFLEYFLELPKGQVVLNLDGLTDIFKAKEILKGHMCIAGDVPAAMLTLGTPEQVSAYVKELIDIVGEGSGFILTSGCSVPIDAKPENVKAMIDTAKSYYPHRKVFY